MLGHRQMNVSNGSKIRITGKRQSPFSNERRLLKGLYILLLVETQRHIQGVKSRRFLISLARNIMKPTLSRETENVKV